MKALTWSEFAELRAAAARALKTAAHPVVVGSEAIFALEAVARGCAAPGRRFLNLVTGPYGREFGAWLREGGAEVLELETPYDEVADPEAVRRALAEARPDALSCVYAEAVTGGANPVREIAALAGAAGALTIVDAVSSVGADPFCQDDWGVDIAVAGMQKALLGSNGVSFVAASARGMAWMRANPRAPRHSLLSLPELWAAQAAEVPAWLPVLEARDALRAFREIAARGGIDALVRRHQALAARVRAGVAALGGALYQRNPEACSALDTTVVRPRTRAAEAFSGAGIVQPGNGPLAGELLRINHYGENCTEADAAQALATLKRLLAAD